MVPMPPDAPVKTMRRAAFLSSDILVPPCKFAVPLERAGEMVAHRAARFGRVAGGDRRHDARMLALDAFEIGAPLGRRVQRKPHALARDDMPSEKLQEARELAVAGGLRDGAVEGEILRHGALAAAQRPVD